MNDLEDKFYLVINQMLEKTDMKVINVNINRKKIDYDIRLVIDSDRGVNIDDCAYVSRIAKDAINLEKIIETDFNLEVSSPGINRPLFTLNDYASFVGEIIKLKLKIPIEDRKNLKGKIVGIENSYVIIETDNVNIKVDFNNINKGNIIKDI